MLVRTYDIINAGPKNRFMANGKIVSNSGRGWQAQNLAKPTKELEKILPTVVKCLEFMDAKSLEMVFEKPFDVLSSCVRPIVQAPEGYVFADVDLSAIENRVLGWMAKCAAILEVFEKGQDPYIAFATKLFHKTYEELWHEYKVLGNSSKRTIAKPGVLGCFGSDTLVLTDHGWKRICEVEETDKVHDGERFVQHSGVVHQGSRRVLRRLGVYVTSDHEIFVNGVWKQVCQLGKRPSNWDEAIHSATGKLSNYFGLQGARVLSICASVFAARKKRFPAPTLCAAYRPNVRHARSAPGGLLLLRRWERMSMTDLPTASTQQERDARIQLTKRTVGTAGVELRCVSTMQMRLCYMWLRNWVSTASSKLIGLTMTAIMSRAIFVCRLVVSKIGIRETWDILNAGPNSRFVILSEGGPLLVHNCGYMLGAGEEFEDRKTGEKGATGLLGYAWNMGVRQFTQQDSVLSVETFREAYKEVKTFWYAIDNAARKCISTNREVDCWPITFDMKGPFMRMRLPSGRYLHYFRPRIMDWKTPWGEIRPTVTYEGLNDKKVWARMSTHPGKLTENCWNFDTLILTDSGVKAITEVTRTDLVWDGTTWVNHGGVSYSGERETVDFSGAKVTPEHKVETRWGWKRISEVSPDEATSAFHRHYGDSTWEALCGSTAWVGSGEGDMAPPVRLRIGNGDGRIRVSQRAVSVLRVFQIRDNFEEVEDSRNVEASSLRGMAVDVSAVSKCKTSSLQKLRRAWNRCVQSVGEVRVFLGRYGRDVQNRFVHRAGEQQQGVLQDELRLGESKNAMQEQAFQPHHRHTQREDDDCRSIRVVRGREDDAFISEQRGLPKESDVRSTGCVEPVYDILNCGPRSAFTVVLPDGRLILSHNCDQAISRDLLVHGMRLAHTEGLSIRIHVHDQLVALVRESEADRQLQILKECMQAQPSWAKGLPLGSNGFLSRIFTKD